MNKKPLSNQIGNLISHSWVLLAVLLVIIVSISMFSRSATAGDVVSLRYGHGLSTYHAHKYSHYRKDYSKHDRKHYKRYKKHKKYLHNRHRHHRGYDRYNRYGDYDRRRGYSGHLGLHYRFNNGSIYYSIPLDGDRHRHDSRTRFYYRW